MFGNILLEVIIKNLFVLGSVIGNNYVGGIVGRNEGNILNVYVKVNVNGN